MPMGDYSLKVKFGSNELEAHGENPSIVAKMINEASTKFMRTGDESKNYQLKF